MRFQSWYFLFLLALLPLLYRYWREKNRLAKVNFPIPLNRAVKKTNPAFFLFFIRYAVFFLMILALARPQSSFKQTERTVSGIDIMLVMDVSASMNIEDLADRSRFDMAKETMQEFVRGRQNDRIGFAIFSGEPLTLAPPTLDYGLLLSSIKSAASGVLKDGTGIGDGLALAVNMLRN